MSGHVHPTRDDGVVAALSEVVGGPVGPRAAARRRFLNPLALLLLLTSLTFVLGLTTKLSCVDQQWRTDLHYAHNDKPDQTRFTHVCESDIAQAYTDLGFVELAWPWSLDAGTRGRFVITDDSAGVGLWSYGMARLTHLFAGSPDLSTRYRQPAGDLPNDPDIRRERVIFTGLNALGLALMALFATAALALLHRRRPWDAAGFALSPLLLFTGIVSWELIAVAAAAGALWAWSRRRPALAGVLIGVGAAFGLWPALLLLAFGLAGWRRGRAADVVPAAVSALGLWTLLNAPAFLTGRGPWERFFTAGIDRGADHGSVWTVATNLGMGHDVATVLSWSMMGAWVAAVIALAALCRIPPRAEQIGLVLVAGVLMLKLAYDPALALWLLPLAVVARPRWRDLLIWQSGEVFFLAMHSWWLGGQLTPGGDGEAWTYLVAIIVRLGCTAWLVAVVARDVWAAHRDPVAEERLD